MQNRRKMNIKVNGKKTNFNPLNNKQELTNFSKNHPRKDKFRRIKNTNIQNRISASNVRVGKKRNFFREWKPVIVACISAVVIGSFLGWTMIQMFGNLEHDVTRTNNQPPVMHEELTKNDNNKQQEQKEHYTLEPIHTYVLQGGVFSEKENAQQLAKKFQKNHINTIRWKRDQQFFLFAGIASTNEQAEQMTKTFVDRGLDVYVKEWSIPEIDLQVTEQEYDWLRAFQNQWEKTVKIRSEGGTVPTKEWEELLEDSPKSTELSSFIDTIQPHVENLLETDDQFERSSILLHMLYEYEMFLL
ncbi:MAG TPA: hypothetical protein VK119_08110 [Bacillota bacterium]|nr:hypothetical protein [Bacillota bacterium]